MRGALRRCRRRLREAARELPSQSIDERQRLWLSGYLCRRMGTAAAAVATGRRARR